MSNPSLLQPGARFGRYELERRIGRGGMGEVWRATAHGPGGFQKRVVIKTILPELAHSENYVSMLINEASLSARLNHPNIVQVFELGIERGVHFIAMEYLPGRTLGQVLSRAVERERSLPAWLVLEAMALCCDGLAYAHSLVDDDGVPLGLLHHDLSPGNVMLSFAGRVTILDFGIAVATKFVDPTSRTLQGKYMYMAPERVRGLPADARSDLYSLGVILYTALTYRRPFQGATDADLLRAVLEHRPPPPSAEAPWVDPELDGIVMRAMARSPSARYQGAAELSAALRSYLRRRGLSPTQTELATSVSSLFPEAAEAPAPIRAAASRARVPNHTPQPYRARPLPDIPRATTPQVAAAGSASTHDVPSTSGAESQVSAIEVDLDDLLEVHGPSQVEAPSAHTPAASPEEPRDIEAEPEQGAKIEAEPPAAPDEKPAAPGELTVSDLFDAFASRRRAVLDVFTGSPPSPDHRASERDIAVAELFTRVAVDDPSEAWAAPRRREPNPPSHPFGTDDIDP